MSHTILIHGFLGAAQDWDAVRTHCGEAARGWHAVEVAQLASSESIQSRGIDALAEAILQSAPVGLVTLVGYSLGARIALSALEHSPQRVRQVILISGGPALTDPIARAARLGQDQARASDIREGGLGPFLRGWYAQPLFDSLRMSESFDAVLARRQEGDANQWAAIVEGCSPGRGSTNEQAIRRSAAAIRTIVGSMDHKYIAIAKEMEEAGVAAADLIESAGHAVHLEQPAACARAILRAQATHHQVAVASTPMSHIE
ncbi:MAG: alpha/beta fold hydrolase [Planctomycetota bacterium]|nr:alpha/beta fold hydrolase [Planctomycetota bacterium]